MAFHVFPSGPSVANGSLFITTILSNHIFNIIQLYILDSNHMQAYSCYLNYICWCSAHTFDSKNKAPGLWGASGHNSWPADLVRRSHESVVTWLPLCKLHHQWTTGFSSLLNEGVINYIPTLAGGWIFGYKLQVRNLRYAAISWLGIANWPMATVSHKVEWPQDLPQRMSPACEYAPLGV